MQLKFLNFRTAGGMTAHSHRPDSTAHYTYLEGYENVALVYKYSTVLSGTRGRILRSFVNGILLLSHVLFVNSRGRFSINDYHIRIHILMRSL